MSGKLRIVIVAAFATLLLTSNPSTAQVANSVVISEIHYNPSGEGESAREFLELYNPGTEAVDLTGYSFTDGIDAGLDGVSIPAGGYVIIAPDENTAEETYDVAPVATYSGKLNNGGETVTLTKGDDVVDSVSYDDGGKWPDSADGDGPSLELALGADGGDAASWNASDPAPTPGKANTIPVVPGAEITDLTVSPSLPDPDQVVEVSVRATGGATPVLTYLIGFGQPVTAPMSPAGGEGQFQFSIPGQTAGELIRYRIELEAAESVPAEDDTIGYQGLVVADPEVETGGAPVLQWFISEMDYREMMGNTTNRDLSFFSVLAYDGAVYDNSVVEIRGGQPSRFNDKQALNFDLPKGYSVVISGIVPYGIDEFALAADQNDSTRSRAETSWWIFDRSGFPTVGSGFVRLERNSDFDGVYRFQEKLDGAWRKNAGLDSGGFYKAGGGGFTKLDGFVHKSGSNRPDAIAEIVRRLNEEPSDEKASFIYDWFDIPNLVNYTAVMSIIGHNDSVGQNFYIYQDDAKPNLWSLYPWDLDTTLDRNFKLCRKNAQTDMRCTENPLFDSLYEIPDLEAMVWTRVATIIDDVFASGKIEALQEDRIASIGALTADLETEAWPGNWNSVDAARQLGTIVGRVRSKFETEARVPQPGDPTSIEIVQMDFDPPDEGPEVLVLGNTGAVAVDLSGWTIDAVFKNGKTIPAGTVILPDAQVILTDSAALLREKYPEMPNLVVVEYNGGLKKSGELLELVTSTGQLIDSVAYTDSDEASVEQARTVTVLGPATSGSVVDESGSVPSESEVVSESDEPPTESATQDGPSAASGNLVQTLLLVGILLIGLLLVPAAIRHTKWRGRGRKRKKRRHSRPAASARDSQSAGVTKK